MEGGGEMAQVVGDVACDELENPWGLGFAKEAGGVVVESVAPGDDHVRGHGVVEEELVEAGGHVRFGEVLVGGKECIEVVDVLIADVGVGGGEVDVTGVNEEAEFVRAFFLEEA